MSYIAAFFPDDSIRSFYTDRPGFMKLPPVNFAQAHGVP